MTIFLENFSAIEHHQMGAGTGKIREKVDDGGQDSHHEGRDPSNLSDGKNGG